MAKTLVRWALAMVSAIGMASPALGAEDGVLPGKLVLGQSAALHGLAAERPTELNQGELLYFKSVNETGGVHGRKIELITYDDRYEPPKALENVRKLVDVDKVFCLFGIYGSAVNKTVLPFVETSDVPLVAAMSSEESLTQPPRKNIFMVRTNSKIEMDQLTRYLIDHKGVQEFGLIYQDDALGLSMRLAAISALHKHGLKLVAESRFKRGTEAVDESIAALAGSNAKAVIIGAQIQPAVAILRKSKEKNFRPIFVGGATLASTEIAAAAQATAAPFYVSLAFPPIEEKSTSEFVRRFMRAAKAGGVKPSQSAAQGYLNAMVMVEALRRAGPEPTRTKLRMALEGMDNANFDGVAVHFSATQHAGLNGVSIAVAKDGQFVTAP